MGHAGDNILPTGTATPLPSRQLLVHCTAQPEVGLLRSEGWRQGLGTSR